ncbi:hypothetical protein Tco_1117187, partial [Tanacetum coccineum]
MNNSVTIAYRFEITLQLCFFDGTKSRNLWWRVVVVDDGDGGLKAVFGSLCGALTNKCGGFGELIQVHLLDFNSSDFGKSATNKDI